MEYKEGQLAIVKTKSGLMFVARWTLAPGIDYFWHPVREDVTVNYLIDPVVKVIWSEV